ncbi:MAG TPA: hypothetical protein VKA27_00040 [Sunxiuqinia sp.]|nr:hypothetical protein [Sunxiuqinia sp.]
MDTFGVVESFVGVACWGKCGNFYPCMKEFMHVTTQYGSWYNIREQD